MILAEGYQLRPGEPPIAPTQVTISPGFFEAMGTGLVAGRFFDDRDAATAQAVTIVDARLARRFWPGQNPLGQRMFRPTDINRLTAVSDRTVFLNVVGVIREMKVQSLTQGDEFVGACYFPVAQNIPPGAFGAMFMTFAVRSAVAPSVLATSVRGAITGLDPLLPVFDAQSMEERTDRSLVSRRSPVFLSLGFGALALFLSAIGIYGVLAYLVTQRTRELGIRIALGSSATSIFQLILREGLIFIAAGLVLGAAGAFALKRTLETQLFGVTATDPFVAIGVTALLVLIALIACALPARRATRIDPVVALSE